MMDLSQVLKGFLWALFKLWPFWVVLLVFALIPVLFEWFDLQIANWQIKKRFKEGERWRSDRDLLRWLRGMDPSEFEDYIANLFSSLGYKARAVGKSHDGGVDVVAEKDGIINYIQCKKFITSEVPVGAVRDFYGSLADHLTNGQGYFITTNKFTLEARKFTEDKPIELIDGFRLVEYIRLAQKDRSEHGRNQKNCPICGSPMVKRTGKFGDFYGCSKYPICKGTLKT